MDRRVIFLTLLGLACLAYAEEECKMPPLDYDPPKLDTKPLEIPSKTLMGPGPSTPNPRILQAQALPLLGHMHPEFLKIMDESREWLKYAFQTKNAYTLAISGTGHAAMEASVANMVEPGDVVVVGVNGIWGERMAILCARYGAVVHEMETPLGTAFAPAQIEEALKAHKPKILFLTHGESSTGVFQPLDGVGDLCEKYGALLFVDSVCTLGGVPLMLDAMKVDISYSGSQKCLGVPPGASPISFSDKAVAKMKARSTPVQSYYFDMDMIGQYWQVEGKPRIYHHTGMISNVYSLREGLAMLAEEGIDKSWERHRQMAEQLWEGIEAMGLELLVQNKAHRLPTVTTIKVPAGVDWAKIPAYMMEKYKIEVSGGLGPSAGKVWRIGMMGFNAYPRNVVLTLHALREALVSVGHKVK